MPRGNEKANALDIVRPSFSRPIAAHCVNHLETAHEPNAKENSAAQERGRERKCSRSKLEKAVGILPELFFWFDFD